MEAIEIENIENEKKRNKAKKKNLFNKQFDQMKKKTVNLNLPEK